MKTIQSPSSCRLLFALCCLCLIMSRQCLCNATIVQETEQILPVQGRTTVSIDPPSTIIKDELLVQNASLLEPPLNGVVVVSNESSNTNGLSFLYTPNDSFVGMDDFQIQYCSSAVDADTTNATNNACLIVTYIMQVSMDPDDNDKSASDNNNTKNSLLLLLLLLIPVALAGAFRTQIVDCLQKKSNNDKDGPALIVLTRTDDDDASSIPPQQMTTTTTTNSPPPVRALEVSPSSGRVRPLPLETNHHHPVSDTTTTNSTDGCVLQVASPANNKHHPHSQNSYSSAPSSQQQLQAPPSPPVQFKDQCQSVLQPRNNNNTTLDEQQQAFVSPMAVAMVLCEDQPSNTSIGNDNDEHTLEQHSVAFFFDSDGDQTREGLELNVSTRSVHI